MTGAIERRALAARLQHAYFSFGEATASDSWLNVADAAIAAVEAAKQDDETKWIESLQPGERGWKTSAKEWNEGNGFAVEAAKPAPEAVEPLRALPDPGSPEASAMLDSVLAEYGWPSNKRNAARAGWVAAMRWLKTRDALSHSAPETRIDGPAYLDPRHGWVECTSDEAMDARSREDGKSSTRTPHLRR